MCWKFDGLVLAASTDKKDHKLIPAPAEPWTHQECSKPGHNRVDAPKAHDLPIEFQLKIAKWAATCIQDTDPEYSIKFARVLEQGSPLGSDQTIFDKYLLRIRKDYDNESNFVVDGTARAKKYSITPGGITAESNSQTPSLSIACSIFPAHTCLLCTGEKEDTVRSPDSGVVMSMDEKKSTSASDEHDQVMKARDEWVKNAAIDVVFEIMAGMDEEEDDS